MHYKLGYRLLYIPGERQGNISVQQENKTKPISETNKNCLQIATNKRSELTKNQ